MSMTWHWTRDLLFDVIKSQLVNRGFLVRFQVDNDFSFLKYHKEGINLIFTLKVWDQKHRTMHIGRLMCSLSETGCQNLRGIWRIERLKCFFFSFVDNILNSLSSVFRLLFSTEIHFSLLPYSHTPKLEKSLKFGLILNKFPVPFQIYFIGKDTHHQRAGIHNIVSHIDYLYLP